MKQHARYLTKTLFIATCLVLGCTSSGSLGCGTTEEGPTIDSELLGVYQINSYRGSEDGCDQLSDITPAPSFLVLYSFLPNDSSDEPRLGGGFCSDVDTCRQRARDALEPPLGYSFIEGDDASGWKGWAIESGGPENDQCRASVQAHVMTSSAGAVDIETRTFETVFPGDAEGTVLTCSNRDALNALSDDLPCQAIIVLAATFEAGL